MTGPKTIPLRPAQRKRVEQLVKEFEAAKAALDGFMFYVVEDLQVPEGWSLTDINVGFVPPQQPQQPAGSEPSDRDEANPYKPPRAAMDEALPFA